MKFLTLIGAALVVFIQASPAQDKPSRLEEGLNFPAKALRQLNDKTDALNRRLNRQTAKYLQSLSREERKLKKQLTRKDSTAAKLIFGNNADQYTKLEHKMMTLPGSPAGLQGKYIGHLDSLQTALSFLGQQGLLKQLPAGSASLTNNLAGITRLQNQFNQSEEINKYLAGRRRFLQDQLARYGLGGRLKNYQKQLYYYQAQVEAYRKTIEDPSKLEAKALELVCKTPAFKKFFASHSQLASLFRLPENSPGSPIANVAGLQTRDLVQQDLLQRFGTVPNISQVVQQQATGAALNPDLVKNKINEFVSGKDNGEMPGFVPNNQKTKRFKNRLEFGTNLQSVKGNTFFPSTSDIGLSVGYKFNDRSIVGIGSSYKMGWGKSARYIRITHEGVGLRSFVDYKVKGDFWASGGAEMNYRSQFSKFEMLRDFSPWQKSALIGASKKYKVNNRVKGNVQLLYDFLWKEQVPRTQPVVFRIGYSLK